MGLSGRALVIKQFGGSFAVIFCQSDGGSSRPLSLLAPFPGARPASLQLLLRLCGCFCKATGSRRGGPPRHGPASHPIGPERRFRVGGRRRGVCSCHRYMEYQRGLVSTGADNKPKERAAPGLKRPGNRRHTLPERQSGGERRRRHAWRAPGTSRPSPPPPPPSAEGLRAQHSRGGRR